MSTGTIERTAERWDCTREEYYSDRECLSSTQLKDFIRSPKLYYGRHVTRIYPREESTAFDIGKVLHHVVLEPGEPSPFVVIPDDALNGQGHRKGAQWAAFEAENVGKILLKPAEYRPVELMLESIRNHPRANALLFGDGGERELAIRWTCERHGIKRRSLLDLLRSNVIVDLKTTEDATPEGFAKAAWKFKYMNQVAFYKDAVHALTNEWLPFVYVVVEKKDPFGCACYELDQEFEEKGYDQLNRGITRLKECRESGVWELPGFDSIVSLSAPRWSKFDGEYDFE